MEELTEEQALLIWNLRCNEYLSPNQIRDSFLIKYPQYGSDVTGLGKSLIRSARRIVFVDDYRWDIAV